MSVKSWWGGQGGRTWGTHFLDTKAVASMLCRPVCDSLEPQCHTRMFGFSERHGESTTLTSRQERSPHNWAHSLRSRQHEPVDQLDLDVCGHQDLLVLQPVTRSHLHTRQK